MQNRITMKSKFTGSGGDSEDQNSGLPNRNQPVPVESEVDLFALAGLFVKRKSWIVATVGSVVFVVAVIMFLLPNQYKSTATILPSGEVDAIREWKDLAGLGGFALKDQSSSELFPAILHSHLIRNAILNKEYSFTYKSKPMKLTLEQYFGLDNPDKLRKTLASITSINMDKKTGIIYIAVETKYPELSHAILNQYLTQLESFNRHKSRSRAKDNAQYLARQLKEMELELQQAEDKLEQFQQVNRDWASSSDPEIIKMLSRLQRDIELKSRTYLFLRQEYEIAKFDAQKDIPIVRILDKPSLPTEKSSPHRMLTIAVCGMASLFAALFFVVVFEALKKRSSGPDRESYQALRKDLQRTFPRVTRLVRRRAQREIAGV